ncbi:unnamed protein product, partial [Symbiodinium sp. CCMP2456]
AEETRWRFHPFSRLRSVLRCSRRQRQPQKEVSSPLLDGTAVSVAPGEAAAPSSPPTRPKESSLLSTLRVPEALERLAAG